MVTGSGPSFSTERWIPSAAERRALDREPLDRWRALRTQTIGGPVRTMSDDERREQDERSERDDPSGQRPCGA